ncbi:RNA-binding protein 25 isoform X1 [Rhipicephalus microplus]|uniref:RNA-binding protein 25 isoform X1 n=1 Tax=Rhipicephalus microplus TaxID=6941 RepID=UPI003F6D772F
MAFPPHRPPLGMPGMPMPPMLAPPYTMPHMVPGGMIPMAMGVMPPMMAHVAVTVPPSIPILAQPPQQPSPQPRSQGKRGHGTGSNSAVIEKKPLVRRNQQQAQHENTSKGPPVTVFVGNITERASDNLIRLILQRCGTVVSWKRVQGANGWLQGFGFCEYGDPESAMRAIRILHDWEIGDKKLVVKVDAKTKEKLDEYKASKRTTSGQQQQQQPGGSTDSAPAADGANSEAKPQPTDDIDEAAWRQDRDTREAILHLLRSHSGELSRGTEREADRSNNATKSPRNTRRNSPEPEREYKSSKNHRLMQELDEMDIEEDKRNLITREIDKFRDTYKPSDLGLTVNSWGSFVQRLRRKVAARPAGSSAAGPIEGLSVKIASYQSASGSHVTHFPVISSLALGDYSDSLHNSHSQASSDMEKQQEEDRDRERERRRERKERRDRERSPDRSSRARDRERTTRDSAKEDRADERSSRDRDRESSREPKSSSDSAQPASSSQPPPSRSDRAPSKARSESPERDWVRERERERERELREVMRPRDAERDWEREREEEEEAYERKKLERKLREKEAAYQERLRNWEARERRKAKEYEKERLKEEEKLAEEAKEARRLKEFLEDYEDERDDVKYYKGAALQRRMKDREKEIELDNRDRQREREELEDLQVKLKAEGHPDPVAEAKRIHHEEEVRLLSTQPHLVPVVRPEPPEPEPEPTRGGRNHPSSPPPARRPSQHSRALPQSPKAEPRSPPPRRESSSTRRTRSPSPVSAAPPVVKVEEDGSGQNSLSGFSDVATPQEEGRSMGFGVLKLGGSPGQTSGRKSPTSSSKRKKLSAAASQAFGNGEEEDSAEARKKRKLVPLEDEEAHKQLDPQQQQQVQHMNTEEKRKHIKSLIDRIPTSKEELFNFNFDRSLVDNALMDKRIRPWINKKIIEYIGEEEPTLVDFICSKVLAGSAAQSILNDVSMVLDEEAEVFVVKMWRLLIYEIEAKKVGLVK